MRERKGVDLDGRGGGKKLGRTGGEAMIRINYARKKFISNIDKKKPQNPKNLKFWNYKKQVKFKTKFPKQTIYNNESLKIPPLSSCSVGPLLLGMSPALMCGLYTQWDSPGKRSFFIPCGYQVEIASWLGMWDDVHVPISILGPYVVWTCNSPKHASTVSRCSFVWQSYCGLKTLFP